MRSCSNTATGCAPKLRAAGVEDAFKIRSFVDLYIRPLFCQGIGPFRWIAVSGNPADIHTIDDMILRTFSSNHPIVPWIEKAREHVKFTGLPARIGWLGYGERSRLALMVNDAVRDGTISGPIAFTRDHLDSGSAALPHRETENMRDGSDAIADWPLLNALLNCASGADLVAIHGLGGRGVSAGVTIVADGTTGRGAPAPRARRRHRDRCIAPRRRRLRPRGRAGRANRPGAHRCARVVVAHAFTAWNNAVSMAKLPSASVSK